MKKAFTLAETLITLGIIGVVATLTLPNLMANYKNKVTVAKLQKVYNTLSNAVESARSDDDKEITYSDGTNEGMLGWFDAVIKPHAKILKTCVFEAGCWSDGAKLLNGQAPTYDQGNKGVGGNNVTFNTPDGFLISADVWAGDGVTAQLGVTTSVEAVVMYVDINGKAKPNVVGKDIFVLVYTDERGLLPAGKDLDDATVEANCKGTGVYCFEYLLRNDWDIESLGT